MGRQGHCTACHQSSNHVVNGCTTAGRQQVFGIIGRPCTATAFLPGHVLLCMLKFCSVGRCSSPGEQRSCCCCALQQNREGQQSAVSDGSSRVYETSAGVYQNFSAARKHCREAHVRRVVYARRPFTLTEKPCVFPAAGVICTGRSLEVAARVVGRDKGIGIDGNEPVDARDALVAVAKDVEPSREPLLICTPGTHLSAQGSSGGV